MPAAKNKVKIKYFKVLTFQNGIRSYYVFPKENGCEFRVGANFCLPTVPVLITFPLKTF